MKLFALPGLDGTADLFEPFVRSAPHGFEVATARYPPDRELDYAGHLEIARRFLPEDGPFLLLGESFSGPIATWLAAEAPAGLAGLILCNTFVRPPSWSGFRHLPWELLFRRPVPKNVVRRRLAGRWIDPEIVRAVRTASRTVAPEVMAKRLRETLTVDARDALAAVRVPVLALHSRRDGLVRPRCLRAILEVKPETRVAEIDAPHMLLQIAPREAWTAIEAFAASTAGRPASLEADPAPAASGSES